MGEKEYRDDNLRNILQGEEYEAVSNMIEREYMDFSNDYGETIIRTLREGEKNIGDYERIERSFITSIEQAFSYLEIFNVRLALYMSDIRKRDLIKEVRGLDFKQRMVVHAWITFNYFLKQDEIRSNQKLRNKEVEDFSFPIPDIELEEAIYEYYDLLNRYNRRRY
jgi:hypothetical protein